VLVGHKVRNGDFSRSNMGPHKRGKWGRSKEREIHAHTVMKASKQSNSIWKIHKTGNLT
jgi:hypothetical protein